MGFCMRKFREMASREQIALIPSTIDEYVPKDDIVRYLDVLVDSFDLSKIEGRYSTFGRPGYAPRMLVKVLLYGKMRGIRSCRELSRACEENLRFIYLAQNEKPDFRTINVFRKEFSTELAGLLCQTIEIGIREKLIKLENICIDGTKLGAFAGRKSFKDPKGIEQELIKLESEIRASIERDIELDKEDDERFSGGSGHDKLPTELEDKQVLAQKLKRALAVHKEMLGEKPSSVSITDPECRFMKSKGINPSWNGQAAVDADSRLVVAGYITNATGDSSELISVLDQVEENTGAAPKNLIADRGYTLYQDLKELETRKTEGWVSQIERPVYKFRYNKSNDTYTCPIGEKLVRISSWTAENRYHSSACVTCRKHSVCSPRKKRRKILAVPHLIELARKMRLKMQSPQGELMRKLRAATVEPLFGYLKYAKKLRQLTVRGMKRASEEWMLELAAYNAERLCKLTTT